MKIKMNSTQRVFPDGVTPYVLEKDGVYPVGDGSNGVNMSVAESLLTDGMATEVKGQDALNKQDAPSKQGQGDPNNKPGPTEVK